MKRREFMSRLVFGSAGAAAGVASVELTSHNAGQSHEGQIVDVRWSLEKAQMQKRMMGPDGKVSDWVCVEGGQATCG